MASCNSTVQITDLVRVCHGVYANDSSLVMASKEDDWCTTLHICRLVWTNDCNTGIDVTSYSYSNVAYSCKKIAFHVVADLQVHCILNKQRCYCTRLSRNHGDQPTDSIKHTLTLFPSPIVAPNISWPNIARTIARGMVTWGGCSEDILTCDEQQLLEMVAKKLYKERATPVVGEASPCPVLEDINLGSSIDLMNTSCFSTTQSGVVGRVGEDGMVYFPSSGGSSNVARRVKDLLHQKNKVHASKRPQHCPIL